MGPGSAQVPAVPIQGRKLCDAQDLQGIANRVPPGTGGYHGYACRVHPAMSGKKLPV